MCLSARRARARGGTKRRDGVSVEGCVCAGDGGANRDGVEGVERGL